MNIFMNDIFEIKAEPAFTKNRSAENHSGYAMFKFFFQSGVHRIDYLKKDNTKRTIKVTLDIDIYQREYKFATQYDYVSFKKTESTRTKDYTMIKLFDVENKKWVNLKIENMLSIEPEVDYGASTQE